MKKVIRICLYLFALLFILINIIAYNHAYRFTHFGDPGPRLKAHRIEGIGTKLKLLLLGANLPRPENTMTPAPPFETLNFEGNETLEAWYQKVPSAKGTVLMFHGYGNNKSSLIPKAKAFQEMGFNTLMVDFYGSGGSKGNSTSIGYHEAKEVAAAYEFIQQHDPQDKLILFGTSMGAVAILKATSQYPIDVQALIIECPFGSMQEAVENRFEILGIPAFPFSHFLLFWGGVQNDFWAYAHDTYEYAENIDQPVLLMYGKKDNRVKMSETKRIFENLKGGKELIVFPEAGHNITFRRHKKAWTKSVNRFMSSYIFQTEKLVLQNQTLQPVKNQ